MRSIKGLLLASAAGLAAVSGASAADLPVKAKPVEYVKVCSLYGAGFFYVPGTETCLKIGGYVRMDTTYGRALVSGPAPAALASSFARFTRTDTDFGNSQRSRLILTTDWRTQSDYGVIRAYMAIVAQNTSPADAVGSGVAGLIRAFIQFAGFTVGHAASYFDFINGADYFYTLPQSQGSCGGPNGCQVIAYTWQLGNGWSASIDAEESIVGRAKSVVNASAAWNSGVTITQDRLAQWQPDIVGNLRVDQAWGSWQVMGALHNASGGYYAGVGSTTGACAAAALTSCGHPGEAWGFAVGTGIKLTNFLQPKDTIEAEFVYSKGATGYSLGAFGFFAYDSGNQFGSGYGVDGVFTTGQNVELTSAWSIAAGYQHYWNAQWRTSLWADYQKVDYNATATSYLCNGFGTVGTNAAAYTVQNTLVTGVLSGSCNPDFSYWHVGTRTAWNPHPTLEIGIEWALQHLNTANAGSVVTLANNGARPAGPYVLTDIDAQHVTLRVQKTVLP